MINPLRLDNFVARFISRLPDSLVARQEDLVTLLQLLPKNYPRRPDLLLMVAALRAHEAEQAKFTGEDEPDHEKNAPPVGRVPPPGVPANPTPGAPKKPAPVAQTFLSAGSGDFPVPSFGPVPSSGPEATPAK